MSQGRSPLRPNERDPAAMQVEWSDPDHSSFGGIENDPDWVFRLVNTSFQGNTEIMSDMYFDRCREGYVNVLAADHKNNPVLQAMASPDGHCRKKGQILMKMSRFTAESKARQLHARSARGLNREGGEAMKAAQQVSSMPIHIDTTRISETLFGGGK